MLTLQTMIITPTCDWSPFIPSSLSWLPTNNLAVAWIISCSGYVTNTTMFYNVVYFRSPLHSVPIGSCLSVRRLHGLPQSVVWFLILQSNKSVILNSSRHYTSLIWFIRSSRCLSEIEQSQSPERTKSCLAHLRKNRFFVIYRLLYKQTTISG